MYDRALGGEDNDIEDENEPELTDEQRLAMESVFVEVRQRGTRGPSTAAGRRGLVVLEGVCPRGFLAFMERWEVGASAGLCEPISIWESSDGQRWTQVNSSAVKPTQVKEAIDRATAEHEREMQDAQAALRGLQGEHRDAASDLKFLQTRIALERETFARLQQEREALQIALQGEERRAEQKRDEIRADLQAEQKRAEQKREEMRLEREAERKALEAEREQRLREREMVIQQNLVEREGLRQFQDEVRVRALNDTTKVTETLAGVRDEATRQYREQVKYSEGLFHTLRQNTDAMIGHERQVQEAAQIGKLAAVAEASKLRDTLTALPEQSGEKPVPDYPQTAKVVMTGLKQLVLMAGVAMGKIKMPLEDEDEDEDDGK